MRSGSVRASSTVDGVALPGRRLDHHARGRAPGVGRLGRGARGQGGQQQRRAPRAAHDRGTTQYAEKRVSPRYRCLVVSSRVARKASSRTTFSADQAGVRLVAVLIRRRTASSSSRTRRRSRCRTSSRRRRARRYRRGPRTRCCRTRRSRRTPSGAWGAAAALVASSGPRRARSARRRQGSGMRRARSATPARGLSLVTRDAWLRIVSTRSPPRQGTLRVKPTPTYNAHRRTCFWRRSSHCPPDRPWLGCPESVGRHR